MIPKTLNLTALILLIFTATFISCKKEIEVCIDGPVDLEAPGTYTYTWCGTPVEQVNWSGVTGNTLNGTQVTIDFPTKGEYHLTVRGVDGNRDASQTFTIMVGADTKTRAEMKNCNGTPYGLTSAELTGYLYASLADLQTDLRNGDRANVVDSAISYRSNYFGGIINNEISHVVELDGSYPDGGYWMYVRDSDGMTSNLAHILEIASYHGNTENLIIQNNPYTDNITQPVITYGEQDFSRLFGATYVLTNVSINGQSTGVPACNADDTMTLNLDGTWEYNVGTDDCNGNSRTSTGTFNYNVLNGNCNNPVVPFDLVNTSNGSLAQYIDLTVQNGGQSIDLAMYDTVNQVQLEMQLAAQ